MKTKKIKILTAVISIIIIFAVICIGSDYVNRNNITYRDIFTDLVYRELQNSEFSVVFFDVGCADCALVTYGDFHIMIDLGGNSTPVINYLEDYHISHLDLLVATHSDTDHISGMPDLIEDVSVAEFWCSKYELSSDEKSFTFNNILKNLTDNGTTVKAVDTSDSLNYQDLSLQILSPTLEYDNDNDNSLVIKATYKGTSFLFTGDISKKVEKQLINNNTDLLADVIKISHHGSKTASTADFLQAVAPSLAVISAGYNTYSLPSNEVIDRLNNMDIYAVQTMTNGNIYITSNGREVTLLQ